MADALLITKIWRMEEITDHTTQTIRQLAISVETETGPWVLRLTTSAARELEANLATILQGKNCR